MGRNNCQHVVSTRLTGCDRSLSRDSKGARANNYHGPQLALIRHWSQTPNLKISLASRSCCQQNSLTGDLVDDTCDGRRVVTVYCMSVNRNPLTPLPWFVVNLLHNLFLHLCESWQAFDWHCESRGPSAQLLVTQVSGVARNFRQGMRQSVAFLSVHSRSAALPSRVSLIDKFYCVCLFPFAKFFFFFIYVVLPHTLVK